MITMGSDLLVPQVPGIEEQAVVDYWATEAEEALRVARHLVDKEDYSYALFFGHLAIERVLKALYVRQSGEHAPPIHDLLRLARAGGVDLDDNREEALIIITAFNLEARYPDFKRAFREKCAPEFTLRQMNIIREQYQWLKSRLG